MGQFVAFKNQSIIMRIYIFPTEPLTLPFFKFDYLFEWAESNLCCRWSKEIRTALKQDQAKTSWGLNQFSDRSGSDQSISCRLLN